MIYFCYWNWCSQFSLSVVLHIWFKSICVFFFWTVSPDFALTWGWHFITENCQKSFVPEVSQEIWKNETWMLYQNNASVHSSILILHLCQRTYQSSLPFHSYSLWLFVSRTEKLVGRMTSSKWLKRQKEYTVPRSVCVECFHK